MAPTFFERARKFIVAAVGVAVLFGAPALDILGESDFTTVEGIVAAAVALLTAYGVYRVPNERG